MAQFGQLQSFAQNTRPAASADVPGAVPGVPVFNDKATEYAEHMMAEHQQGQQQQNKLQQTHALAAQATLASCNHIIVQVYEKDIQRNMS